MPGILHEKSPYLIFWSVHPVWGSGTRQRIGCLVTWQDRSFLSSYLYHFLTLKSHSSLGEQWFILAHPSRGYSTSWKIGHRSRSEQEVVLTYKALRPILHLFNPQGLSSTIRALAPKRCHNLLKQVGTKKSNSVLVTFQPNTLQTENTIPCLCPWTDSLWLCSNLSGQNQPDLCIRIHPPRAASNRGWCPDLGT